MAVTVLTDLSSANDSRTLSWTIPALAVGDVIVICAQTWDTADTLGTPSGTGLSFTLQAEVATGSHTHVYIWTAVASSGGTSVVVTATTGTSSIHTGVLYQCPTVDGYALAGTPNTTTANSGGSGGLAPSASITTTSGNLVLAVDGDWDGAATAPTYTGTGTEDGKMQSSGNSSHYYFHDTAAGASTTVGMSAPLQRYAIAAVEVLKGAAGAVQTPSAGSFGRTGGRRSRYPLAPESSWGRFAIPTLAERMRYAA